MDALLDQMAQAERLAQSQSNLVHVLTWEETQAGIWEPPPKDELAVATFNGLLLNCVNSGLYMANYNLVRPIGACVTRQRDQTRCMAGMAAVRRLEANESLFRHAGGSWGGFVAHLPGYQIPICVHLDCSLYSHQAFHHLSPTGDWRR